MSQSDKYNAIKKLVESLPETGGLLVGDYRRGYYCYEPRQLADEYAEWKLNNDDADGKSYEQLTDEWLKTHELFSDYQEFKTIAQAKKWLLDELAHRNDIGELDEFNDLAVPVRINGSRSYVTNPEWSDQQSDLDDLQDEWEKLPEWTPLSTEWGAGNDK